MFLVNPEKFYQSMRLSAKCCKFVFLCLQHLEGNLQSGVNNFSKALMSPKQRARGGEAEEKQKVPVFCIFFCQYMFFLLN